ncbi:MAG: hypothetical protein IH627_14420 [Rubrivivax sp.]|nr:hypothetical protein [Rubrivivax sp.]
MNRRAAVELLHPLLEAGHLATLNAEDLEEGVAEALRIGVFALGLFPLVGEANGAVPNLVPAQWHARFPAAI